MTLVRQRLTPEDRARTPCLEVPFEVGPGVDSVEVRLTCDPSASVDLSSSSDDPPVMSSGAAVVDLGCVAPSGIRGWSGGARSRFVIGTDGATPGYLPGELEPGVWSVLLGLHRIPPPGLDVIVEIVMPASGPAETEPAPPPAPERRPRRSLPASPGLTWLACDFHAHTVHSDGALGRAELAALAVESGLDVLAVTDHNTVSHHAGLAEIGAAYGLTLLPGQEITTDRGHANAFGDIGVVDFRAPPATWASTVRDRGGLLSINHPLAADCAWHHPLADHPPLAEIWHWTWLDRRWSGPLAWWNAWGWDTVPIGGSDYHRPDQGRPLGAPVTWVAAESADPAAVVSGLRAGRTALAAAVDAPALLRVDDELVAVDSDGLLLVDTEGRRRPVRSDLARFPPHPGPHWIETPMAEVIAITP